WAISASSTGTRAAAASAVARATFSSCNSPVSTCCTWAALLARKSQPARAPRISAIGAMSASIFLHSPVAKPRYSDADSFHGGDNVLVLFSWQVRISEAPQILGKTRRGLRGRRACPMNDAPNASREPESDDGRY